VDNRAADGKNDGTGMTSGTPLAVRISLDPAGRIAPAQIALLEAIAASGSISAAARARNVSYKHAWDKVVNLTQIIGKPVVSAKAGGERGGGTQLTEVGQALVSHFRALERDAIHVAERHILALKTDIEAG
jgi:molybdate transport system regulatory protein